MYIEELLLIVVVVVGIYLYRSYQGKNVGKFFSSTITDVYDKFAPYSFKKVREKTKELGQEYTARQYLIQLVAIGGFTGVVTYLYFYNLTISIIYIFISSFIFSLYLYSIYFLFFTC